MPQDVENSRSDWRDLFKVPGSVKKVFATFPLQTYDPNTLPARSPKHRDENTLYIWTTPSGAQQGHASFNPTCLKWQTYLKFQNVNFRTQASNNHASPTGALPFLLPAHQPSPISANKLDTWATQHGSKDTKPTEPDVRQELYTSLLDHALRRGWLYTLYLHPDNSSVAKHLYVEPSSTNPFVGLAISHQLRNAAQLELSKATPHVSATAVLQEASDALKALSTLLGDGQWFFGHDKPGLFDAAVFAYTFLLMDEGMGWVSNPLAEELGGLRNLVAHRERILSSYY